MIVNEVTENYIMISKRNANKFCCEDISKIENYELAVNDTTQVWHCHHRLEICEFNKNREDGGNTTIDQLVDDGMYYNRPASELIFLTPNEHISLHAKNRIGKNHPIFGKHHSEETKYKISKSRIGKTSPRKGAILTDETKRKISEAHKGKKLSEETKKKIGLRSSINAIGNTNVLGKHWYNNGIIQVLKFDCPEGFVKGRL